MFQIVWFFINWQFSGVFAATAKYRPPHPACLHVMASTTSCGVVHHILPIISRSPEWLDAHYFSYNNIPSYSYAPNLSVRVHTINISKREKSHSTHKVPKRRRLALGGSPCSRHLGMWWTIVLHISWSTASVITVANFDIESLIGILSSWRRL